MASTPPLHISLRNHTNSSTVFAYISALSQDGRRFFVRSDGASLYFPASPSAPQSPLAADVAIKLPPPRQARTITVPSYFAGGPGLVEPSPANTSDPNYGKDWDFMELSFNSSQVYANITYVDFFAIPIALTLYTNNAAKPQHVSGTNENGLNQVVAGMREQHAKDGQGWDQLVKNGPNGQPIRVVSPNVGISMNGALFRDYFTSYVTQVWTKFRNQDMTINTQASYGNRTGRVVANGFLSFTQAPGAYFRKPTAADIFSCSTGPFATNENQERNAIIPRLAAAFNRTTLLLTNQFPNGSTSSQFYTQNPTNHYSRVVHGANLDRRGYAFPYDDVTRDGGIDNSGSVFGPPSLLIVSIGGNGAGLASAPRVPIG